MWNKKSNINRICSDSPLGRRPLADGGLYPVSPDHPRGAVLLYTFVVLILMTLMGTALMVNSRTELQVSANTTQGRDAFTKADASARVALLLGRAFLHPSSGKPEDYLNNSRTEKGFKVELNNLNTDNDLQQLEGPITIDEIRERYLKVTEGGDNPPVTLSIGEGVDRRVVGTAYIGLAKNTPGLFDPAAQAAGGYALTGGGTLADGSYNTGGSGESNIKVHFVISSQGRLPQEGNKSYFDESQRGTYSVVTTIFREIMP